MNRQTLILTQKDILKLVDLKAAIKAVEEAFGQYARGKTQMPAKVYIPLPQYQGDFRAMPAFLERASGQGVCALKWVNVHPNNRKIGLPTVMGTLILSDPKTGFPLSIMDATYLTSLRTAAAGAVAAKYLARRDSKIVGLVGCGVQAHSQLEALRTLFNIRDVRVWGMKDREIKDFVQQIQSPHEKILGVSDVRTCVQNADMVVTTTPSRRPLVQFQWLKKGVHINAIGADAPGKEELDPQILKHAKIVIDDWEQASHSGEINLPLNKKVIFKKDIDATIGEIIIGKKKGRVDQREITVFDSTGLAIQDVAVASQIYQFAIKKKIGHWISLIG